jgi:hypothetical protein
VFTVTQGTGIRPILHPFDKLGRGFLSERDMINSLLSTILLEQFSTTQRLGSETTRLFRLRTQRLGSGVKQADFLQTPILITLPAQLIGGVDHIPPVNRVV